MPGVEFWCCNNECRCWGDPGRNAVAVLRFSMRDEAWGCCWGCWDTWSCWRRQSVSWKSGRKTGATAGVWGSHSTANCFRKGRKKGRKEQTEIRSRKRKYERKRKTAVKTCFINLLWGKYFKSYLKCAFHATQDRQCKCLEFEMRFSQHCCWRFKSSGMWRRVVGRVATEVRHTVRRHTLTENTSHLSTLECSLLAFLGLWKFSRAESFGSFGSISLQFSQLSKLLGKSDRASATSNINLHLKGGGTCSNYSRELQYVPAK